MHFPSVFVFFVHVMEQDVGKSRFKRNKQTLRRLLDQDIDQKYR
jgi:hypothetical protein